MKTQDVLASFALAFAIIAAITMTVLLTHARDIVVTLQQMNTILERMVM